MLSPWRERQARLQISRGTAYGKQEFVDQLRKDGVNMEVGNCVYVRIQGIADIPAFSIRPEDSMHKIFGVVDEDLDDLAQEILSDLGIPKSPTGECGVEVPVFDCTIRDLALFVNDYYLRTFPDRKH